MAQLVDRVILEKLDQPKRHRDREFGGAADLVLVLDGAIGRVIAPRVAVTAQGEPSHTDAARIERELRARWPQRGEYEQGERNSDDSSSHRAPRTWERPPQLCTLCPIFPLFGVSKVTQTSFRMRFGASE